MTAARASGRRRGDRFTEADRLEVRNAVTADYLIGPVDQIARDMERKWGIDRLPDLVSPELAQRFGSQREKFMVAITAVPPNLDDIAEQARRMANAYRALDAEAERIGAPKADPSVWQFEVDGKRCGVVRDGAMLEAAAEANPHLRLYSLDEIARILALDSLRLVAATKDAFPGAHVASVKPQRSRVAVELEDEIPW